MDKQQQKWKLQEEITEQPGTMLIELHQGTTETVATEHFMKRRPARVKAGNNLNYRCAEENEHRFKIKRTKLTHLFLERFPYRRRMFSHKETQRRFLMTY